MPITYIGILIGLAVFGFIFMYIEPILAKHKINNKNEHGSARFSTTQEINKYFKKESITNIQKSGVPIWFDKNLNNVWLDRETPHYVYLGSTGSGKSVTAVIPTCSFIATAKEKRSVFITDPKGEIFNTTSKMFKDNGYEIICIDFRNPELSNRINILEPIIKEYEEYIDCEKQINVIEDCINTLDDESIKNQYNDGLLNITNEAMSHLAETNRLITSVANMITQEKVEQKDPFWNNSAKNLLEGLIGFFLEEYKNGSIKREQITMTSIRKFQNSTMESENAKKFKAYIETKPYGSKSKDSLTSIINASENTYKSIVSVFGSKMALFDDVNVANVTSSSDFEFNVMGTKPTAFYVIVPDEDKTYFTLVTIIVGLLYKDLVKLANKQPKKKLPVEIDWMLDEFANCPPLSDIEAIVSVARSRGMRFHFFIQSFSQLDNVYGKNVSQIILDNCGLIYLKTNTQDTAEAISKRLGKKTIESNSINQSMSLLKYDGNKSTSLMARDLLTPDEVKQLHYKTIIFPIIGYPIFRDTVIYHKIKCYKAGEIKRKVNNLKDLTDTYFTVENIKYDYKRGNEFFAKPKENQDFYKNLDENEKKIFSPVIEKLDQILEGTVYEAEFLKENDMTYIQITINKERTNDIWLKVNSVIDQEYYHLEDKSKGNKTTINVHTKSLEKMIDILNNN